MKNQLLYRRHVVLLWRKCSRHTPRQHAIVDRVRLVTCFGEREVFRSSRTLERALLPV